MSNFSFVVPFRPNGFDRALSYGWLSMRLEAQFPDVELIVGENEDVPFNRSAARNSGVKKVNTDYVFLVDSDTVFNRDVIHAAVALLDLGAPWVIPFATYYRTDQNSARKILSDHHNITLRADDYTYDYVITDPPGPGHDSPDAGLLGFRTEDFLSMGGYCTDFRGWGWEDRALVTVAERVLGGYVRLSWGEVFHLWHPEPQEETWQQPDFEFNRDLNHRFSTARDNIELLKLNGPA